MSQATDQLLRAIQALRLEVPQSIADDIAGKAQAVINERDKLQAFKDFTHQRLDRMGIEPNPLGPHSKAGCRIGDRLDIVQSRMQPPAHPAKDAVNNYGK